jgi:hypothetical protein
MVIFADLSIFEKIYYMKKALSLSFLLCNMLAFAQYNPLAPWVETVPNAKTTELTIDQLTNSFEAYWKDKDKSKKGSGYKPFMRWENHWRNKTDAQGYLINPAEMWQALNYKNTNKQAASSLPVSNWQPLGPSTHTNTGSWSSGQGRVNVVYVDSNNSNTIYIGSPAGGIWKSTTGGQNWIPLADNLPQIGVSGIAVSPTNSNIIYIATGDADANDTYSIGVLKSIDGGASWQTTGLTFTTTTKRSGDILINPNDANMLWVATSDGIYKTTDAGVTWQLSVSGNFAQGRIRLKPNDVNTVYAVSNNRFFKSTDAGTSFTIGLSGLPTASARLLLDVTAANPEYVYILSARTNRTFQGIYKSADGGASFTKTFMTTDVFDGSTQAWYDLALAVSPTNAEELYTGCLNIWKSVNGGTSATKVNNWNQPFNAKYTHADIHYLKFFGSKLYCGSDGGVYVSDNNATSFTDITASAQISQFYKIAVSKQSAYKMVGGLQDNGGHAYSNSQWKNYYGADGMDTAIDPNNSNLYYGFIQNGSSLYVSTNAGNSLANGISSPNGLSGNWVTPLVSNSQGVLYAGYNNVYKLVNNAWTLQNTTPLGTGNLELITIDKNNDNIIYVANNSALYKSIDGGLTFVNSYTASSNITSIAVHSTDSSKIYLTTSGTFGLALKSDNGGTTFTSFSEGLPNIGKNIIIHQARNSNNPLYLGTSLGVFYRDDSMAQWEAFDTNLPNVSVTDLEINLEDEKLVAATYGRGIWITSIPVQVPNIDVKLIAITNPTSVNVNCSNTVIPQVSVKNSGLNAVSQVNITYTLNGTANNFTYNGNIAPSQTQLIDLPTLTLPKGVYKLIVTATTPNDAYSDNNLGSTDFYLNDSGTVNTVNNFENTTDALLSYDEGSASSTWQRGIRTTGSLNSGTNNVYTPSLAGNYADLKKSYLVSQCYNLTTLSNPEIRFKMAFDLELNWDIIYVEYSTNFGQTWQVLGVPTANWYNSNRTPNTTGNDCNNCVGAQWTGTDFAAKDYFYSLSSLNQESNIIFRIVFQSDESANQEGATVDNFVITGTVLSNSNFEENAIAVFPNPTKGMFTVSTGNASIDLVEIYDISGKKIKPSNTLIYGTSQIEIDLNDVATGMYFVKIKSDTNVITKRIIKN